MKFEPHSDTMLHFEKGFHPEMLTPLQTILALTHRIFGLTFLPNLKCITYTPKSANAIHFMWIIIMSRRETSWTKKQKKTLRFINSKLNLTVGKRVNFENDNAFIL